MRRNEIIYHAWVNFSNRGFSNKVNGPGLVGLFLQAGHIKPHVSERTTLFRLAELPVVAKVTHSYYCSLPAFDLKSWF